MAQQIHSVEWRSGTGDSVQIGYLNPHGQKCCGHCDVDGTDHLQKAYKVECSLCGFVYGANIGAVGSDMHERRCPECQGGAVGIRYWRDKGRESDTGFGSGMRM